MDFRISNGLQKISDYREEHLHVFELDILLLLKAKIIHRIFETNSGFHVKSRTTEKVEFLFFESFLLVLTKLSFW